jgi:hypothetical protein
MHLRFDLIGSFFKPIGIPRPPFDPDVAVRAAGRSGIPI